jgi:hypothetical protein
MLRELVDAYDADRLLGIFPGDIHLDPVLQVDPRGEAVLVAAETLEIERRAGPRDR